MNTEILKKANEIIRNANFTKIVKARKNASMNHLVFNTSSYGIYISYKSDSVYVVDNSGNAYELK